MKKILVTGFGPFLNHRENPSQVLVSKLQGPDIETLILPVSFADAPKMIRETMSSQKYHFILSLGLSAGRSKISLERVALNWHESAEADIQGVVKKPGPIYPTEPAALYSQLPLLEWKQKLLNERMPFELSFSAGAYVCNSLYYEILRHQRPGMQGLFVHVPEFTVLSESSQRKALNFLVEMINQFQAGPDQL